MVTKSYYEMNKSQKLKFIKDYIEANTPKVVDLFVQYMVEESKKHGGRYEHEYDLKGAEVSLTCKIGSLLGSNKIQHNAEIILTEDHYVEVTMGKLEENDVHEVCILLKRDKQFKEFIQYRLRMIYNKNENKLKRIRPNHYKEEELTIWFGDNNNLYGLLVAPRFWNGKWENDKSEVTGAKFTYFTIEHVMTTGLVRPNSCMPLKFRDISSLFSIYKEIIKSTSSPYQYEFAEHYIEYVGNSKEPLKIPFIIPEYRFSGEEEYHKYRIDFYIKNFYKSKLNNICEIGIELSPQSTHRDYDKDCSKAREYYQEKNIPVISYSDKDLLDCKKVFDDVAKRYLSVT